MKLKTTLYRQLLSITLIIFGIIFLSLGLLLPKLLLPIYEKSIYEYLKQPLELLQDNMTSVDFDDIAYLYVVSDEIIVSENLSDMIDMNAKQILNNIKQEHGKFNHYGKTYYYYSMENQYIQKIALTNNDYILEIRSDILNTLLPVIIGTLFITIGIILLWARSLVVKIEHLKEKIDNLDNDNYVDTVQYPIDDELSALSQAIDQMKQTLKKQEEYKNQMYQNISHDFKTPLTVIKTHIEGMEDGVVSYSKGSQIIKEQVLKLEQKVHSLLYLNKLLYLKDLDHHQEEMVEINPIIASSVAKFQIQRKDVEFSIAENKIVKVKGSFDMWEAIIDNLLQNFIRYADKKIKITIKNNKIIFYNDGPNVDLAIFSDLFTPYKKGINGQFGLGLSIVKRTLSLLNYEIMVENEKKGVSFIIKID